MNKKQKKVLKRIIVAAVLLVIIGIAGSVVSIPKWLEFLFYLVPYFVIGYDILRKAWKGICNRQMFDENFLMAVATIGAIALSVPKGRMRAFPRTSYSDRISGVFPTQKCIRTFLE